jgi:ubiquinone/menaquinone biosynthesis C-methylase UbiE
MEAKLQRRVQRYGWDRAAPYYDECWRDVLAPATDRLLQLAELRREERVFDVACGTGVLSFAAAHAVGPEGFVLGTDISQKMIEAATATAAAVKYSQCRFERHDAESLPDDGSRFDAALCGLGLMYMPDPERAISLMAQRLRPSGRVVVSVWGRRERCGWAGVFPIIDARVASEVCPLFFRLGNGSVLEDALRRAGLENIVIERLPSSLRYRSAEEACDAALVGGPVALAYAHFDEPTRRAVRREYLDSIAAHRYGEGYEIPGEFVIARAVKPI